jgi:hypothetical protein
VDSYTVNFLIMRKARFLMQEQLIDGIERAVIRAGVDGIVNSE